MTPAQIPYLLGKITNAITFKKIVVAIIFLLFLISSTFQLGQVPGLLGDEGSEGQNIIELQNHKKPPLMGERSYIGAWVDYARMPLVYTFGYSAFSLRLLTLIASILFFWLSYFVLKRLFGEISGLLGLVAVSFSPIYFTQQRLSWAISLLPLFAVLTIYLYKKDRKWSPLLVGIAAGVGANTHILFLATIAGLAVAVIPFIVSALIKNFSVHYLSKLATSILLASIGFWAAFGMQYANLVLYKNDQGNIEKNARNFSARLSDLPILAPKFISGSIYITSYTAQPFSPNFDVTTTSILIPIIISGILLSKKRWLILAWILGLAIHIVVLTYMIEYYAIRYFIITSLFFWTLSGIALGLHFDRYKMNQAGYIFAIALALSLSIFNFKNIIFEFNVTGGSTDNFSISNSRYDSASAFVSINPLLACIADKSDVFSNNIHIRNRLIFLANGNKNISIATQKKDVRWLVKYRMPDDKPRQADYCPNLSHFSVEPVYDSRNVEWPDNK